MHQSTPNFTISTIQYFANWIIEVNLFDCNTKTLMFVGFWKKKSLENKLMNTNCRSRPITCKTRLRMNEVEMNRVESTIILTHRNSPLCWISAHAMRPKGNFLVFITSWHWFISYINRILSTLSSEYNFCQWNKLMEIRNRFNFIQNS